MPLLEYSVDLSALSDEEYQKAFDYLDGWAHTGLVSSGKTKVYEFFLNEEDLDCLREFPQAKKLIRRLP